MKTKTNGTKLSVIPVLLLAALTGTSISAQAASVTSSKQKEGAVIFKEYCSVCHGERGDGSSRAQGGLFPKPRNFTTIEAAKELSRSRMIFSVTYGRPNTAMSAWGRRLGKENVERVVDYIRETFVPLNVEGDSGTVKLEVQANPEDKMIVDGVLDPEFMSNPLPYNLEGKMKWGQMFYEGNCADCHGLSGEGNGTRASFIFPKPRNFRHPASRHKYNRPKLFDVIAHGSHSTEMASWNNALTYQEMGHIAEYVFQTFIEPEEIKTSP